MCMNNETLCWNCANACSNGCSWSRELVPVDGWDAVETRKGYLVKACPQFEKETVRVRSASDLDTDGCIELLKAAGATMYRDYMDGTGFYERDYSHPETLKDTIRKNRRAIEVFLKSGVTGGVAAVEKSAFAEYHRSGADRREVRVAGESFLYEAVDSL